MNNIEKLIDDTYNYLIDNKEIISIVIIYNILKKLFIHCLN